MRVKKIKLINILLPVIIILNIGYVFTVLILLKNQMNLINSLVSSVLLTIFSIYFILELKKDRKKINLIVVCLLFLFSLFQLIFSLDTKYNFLPKRRYVDDFSNQKLTDVLEWANKNNIEINQQFEYSDMVEEYHIISQNKKAETLLNRISEITVAVSHGPNPNKEVKVPNMTSWTTEQVLEFIHKNYLDNIEFEFITSDKKENTVIDQSREGKTKRLDPLKITFSLGEELNQTEITMIDLKNKTKMEAMLWLEQNLIDYQWKEEFSNTIKKGRITKQSIKSGKPINIAEDMIEISLSKGKSIKVPDLKKMSFKQMIQWAAENKLELMIEEKYHDSIPKNQFIDSSHSKGESITVDTEFIITISKGSIKMPAFHSLVDFRSWADEYDIKYEEQYEFNEEIDAGKIIDFSYKQGQTIQTDDTIIVRISQGGKTTVPNLIGLTKSEIIKKLNELNLKYSFIYKKADGKKNIAINQSITKGSKVTEGTTITVTLSK